MSVNELQVLSLTILCNLYNYLSCAVISWNTDPKTIGILTVYLHGTFELNIISFRDIFLKGGRWWTYKSALTPKPGPLGGSVREVKPPAGSHEKRPLLGMKGQLIVHLDFFSLTNPIDKTEKESLANFLVPWPRRWDSPCFELINNIFNVLRCEVLLETICI